MRNHKIDILRGLSIVLVLLHHFNIPYKLQDTFLGIPILGESLSTLLARNGNYGVTMFFVISGFLITQQTLFRSGSLAGIQVKAFYIRRIARIVPCLVLLVLMVTVLGAFGLPPFLNQSPNDVEVSYGLTLLSVFGFWMNILIIKFGWVNYALGVLWSLSVEELFYFAFPWICLLLGRSKALILFLLAIICYAPYFRSLHFGAESGAYLYHYFSSFDGIAIGCLTALITHTLPCNVRLKRYVMLMVPLLMLALYLYAPIKDVSTWSITAFAILTAILIYSFSQNADQDLTEKSITHLTAAHVNLTSSLKLSSDTSNIGMNSNFATNLNIGIVSKIMVWMGQRSYEMYLFHLIILGLMKVFYVPKETLAAEKLWLLPIYFIAVCLLSWLIEKYYSTPLNIKIRNTFIDSKKEN